MLNFSRPLVSNAPPQDHMHEKKNTPWKKERILHQKLKNNKWLSYIQSFYALLELAYFELRTSIQIRNGLYVFFVSKIV